MAIEKFMFDICFDEPTKPEPTPEAPAEPVEGEPPAQVEPEPPVPMFTEEEVAAQVQAAANQAHEAALAQGVEQGRQEILATIEQSLANTEQVIGQQIAQLGQIQAAEHQRQAEDTVKLALTLVKKLLPGYARRDPLSEVEHVLGECLGRLFEAPKVLVTVHPDLTHLLEERMGQITKARGFDGQIMVIGETEVALGDCRVDWGDGSAERNSQAVWSELDEIVARALEARQEETGGDSQP